MSKKTSNLDKSIQLPQIIHDLNNILNSTLVSAKMLENQFEDNLGAINLIRTIKTNSLRASDVINSLSKNPQKTKNDIEIADIVANLESTVRPTLPQNVKLTFRIGKNVNNVSGNYSDLYRAFLNLIINAIESIEKTGKIAFSVKNSPKKDFVLISVKDNGIGISEAKLKQIFRKGFSQKSKKANSGLGLAIVKEIIENHFGNISVVSQPNLGSEFLVSLPTKSILRPISKKQKSNKILLADDDKVILELFSDLLKTYDYKVFTASNGKMAIEQFNNHKFDLVIVDKIMPLLDGLECIKYIRKTNSKIPIILTTGSQEAIDKDYSSLKITQKIKKPWDFENMLEVIRQVLS